jgi:hypothetical protein
MTAKAVMAMTVSAESATAIVNVERVAEQPRPQNVSKRP